MNKAQVTVNTCAKEQQEELFHKGRGAKKLASPKAGRDGEGTCRRAVPQRMSENSTEAVGW